MGNNVTENLQKKMDALKAQYVQQLGGWTAELNIFLQEKDNMDNERFAKIRVLIHKLSGTGGSFGFHDISSTARALEHKLYPEPASGAASFPAVELQTLITACAEAMNTGPSPAPHALSGEASRLLSLPLDEDF